MKLDIVNNTKKGIFQGLINQIITVIAPFLVQTVIIRTLGMEYAGIKGLFSSILTVLSLSELGVGSAIVYNMYRPISEDDSDAICALLNLLKKTYRIIGAVILLIGVILLPFIKYMIHGDYPSNINLHAVFFLYLLNSAFSFWAFSYKAALLDAYQRTDIKSFVGSIIQIFSSFFQIVFLLKTKNYYFFLCISLIFTILNNIIISAYVNKLYPNITCRGDVSADIKDKIKKNVYGLIVTKICGTSRNAFDCLFITAFIGLSQSAVYSNYFLVLTACNGLTGVILSSLLGGIGNNVIIEDKQINYNRMINLHVLYLLISGWMSVCMLCIYQPFMTLWVGRKGVFDDAIMIMFPIYFMIMKLGDIRSVYSDASGLFWENRLRTAIEAIANLVLNLFFVLKWGVFGVLIATVITLFFIGFLGSTIVIFKYYFTKGIFKYLRVSLYYFLVSIFIGLLTYDVCVNIYIQNIFFCLLFRLFVCAFLVPALFFLFCFWQNEFKDALYFLKNALKT